MKETRAILVELIRRNPRFAQDRTFTGLKKAHIVEAMKAALPPARHRSESAIKVQRMIPHLRQAAAIFDTNPAALDSFLDLQEPPKTQIRWTDAEVDAMVERLVEARPELLESDNLDDFGIPDLRAAQEAIPKDRRRTVSTARQVVPPFLAGLERLRERRSPPPPPEETEPEPSEKRTLVRTTAAEWLLVAEKMHEQNPFFGYPYKEHLAGLGEAEIRDAMREALPPNRRRKTVFPFQCREPLLEAFKMVRARLEAEKAEKAAADELEKSKAESEAIAALARADAAKAEEPPPASRPDDALGDAIRTLAKEIGAAFGAGFAGALLPMLEGTLLNVLAAAEPMPSSAKPAAPAASAAPAEPDPDPTPSDPFEMQPPSHYQGPEGIKSRPPKIAVIGPQTTLLRELEHSFPEIDFIFIEKGPKGVPEAVEGCDRIIGVDKFVNEATKMALKKTEKGKAKFCQVHGGTSSVKRQIHLWITSGQLRPPVNFPH